MSDFIKDPAELLDYQFDWTSWLTTGETISSHTITPDAGITVDHETNTTTSVTVWLAGGTADTLYDVHCQVTSSVGRVGKRSFTVTVQPR